jgi:hypothetical protein
MRPGEIFLAQFPFGDIPRMKFRPVLLLSGFVGPVPEVLVAYISSVLPSPLLPFGLHHRHSSFVKSRSISRNDRCPDDRAGLK